ncbi:hypothetical protein LB941_00080 [Ligilactobacillus sp. WILCCON 0076]|uniref:ABC-2 type transporter transmembrane domain-containing protein n=1 Tax=Ligilactobacillus ubinensis TaxID=2876789 RepID=A0A9X2FJE8_9LACO|nr:ABC transporter permease [Ligilactobacillus ubinensis]MCP0885728.1 hypothetical protein [Ligilactobacillus ubinensis]
MSLKKFIFSKFTLIAIIFGVFYHLVMLGIYLPGYKVATHNLKYAEIELVNNDKSNGQKIANSIEKGIKNSKSTHFKLIQKKNLSHAKNNLANHKNVLVIEIPKNYVENLQKGNSVKLNFFVSSAGDQLSHQLGTKIANNLTAKFNSGTLGKYYKAAIYNILLKASAATTESEVTKLTTLQVQKQMQSIVAATPSLKNDSVALQNEQARIKAVISKKIQSQVSQKVRKNVNAQTNKIVKTTFVSANIKDLNANRSNLYETMAPMFFSLSSFIAAMIGAMILSRGLKLAFLKGTKKLHGWLYIELAYIIIAVISPIIGIVILKAVDPFSTKTLIEVYLQHVLVSYTSLNLVGFLFEFLGNIAGLVTLPLILMQSFSSGSVIPYKMLPSAYKFFYNILPVPASVQNDIHIMFGVGSMNDSMTRLIIILAVSLILHLLTVMFKKYPVMSKNKD